MLGSKLRTAIALVMLLVCGQPAMCEAFVQPAARVGGVLSGSASWVDWKSQFLAPDGRVVDTGNKGISHSEGQGYGMLLAVAADDRVAFDLMWSWTRARLGPKGDGLFAWRWSPGEPEASDRNNATDGDMLIAWALGEGADYWADLDLRAAGAGIANAIGKHLVVTTRHHGTVLLPGKYGFDGQSMADGPVVNLSYWIFPALPRLAQLAPGVDWAAVEESGLRLIGTATQGGHGVNDWTSVAEKDLRPAKRFAARFGYDAVRVPLYLTLAGRGDLASRFPTAARGMPIIKSTSGTIEEVAEGSGFQAIAGLVRCAADRTPYPDVITKTLDYAVYYPATLRLLAQMAALLNPLSCLDAAQIGALRPMAWHPTTPSLPTAVLTPAKAHEWQPKLSVAAPSMQSAETGSSTQSSVLAGLLVIVPCGLIGFAIASRRRNGLPSELTDTLTRAPAVAIRQTIASAPPVTASILPCANSIEIEKCPVQRLDVDGRLSKSERLLVGQVELAARTSAQWNQYVGIIVFAQCGRVAATTLDIERAIRAIRGTIRRGDFAGPLGTSEIGVCLALLRGQSDLDSVAARIDAVLTEEFGTAPPFTSFRMLVDRSDPAAHAAVASLRQSATDLQVVNQAKEIEQSSCVADERTTRPEDLAKKPRKARRRSSPSVEAQVGDVPALPKKRSPMRKGESLRKKAPAPAPDSHPAVKEKSRISILHLC